ncbi:MAG: flagellar biosynthetic protein FliO [Nisaea sp.]|jgi:flagellar protein FliO/FliZ|uniref:flagellar biosynthetic protein FliO n=1 Tax=Nisaea sp. TaxID=2024842 RepID=UPI001AFF0AA2|nr:flagellar biosynthetic protein FliO [Nisaea sp.]MBO6559967.1 flagellar biosynthetic protein FliO [Nisaea sp.]
MGFEVYLRFFLAFAFTIGLIGAVYWIARRYAGRFGIVRAHTAGRLSLTGQFSLDTRRRLVLVRRDDREHLLLLGPNNDLLIESGISSDPDSFAAALRDAKVPVATTDTDKSS